MTPSRADAARLQRARQRLARIREIREAQRLAASGRSEPGSMVCRGLDSLDIYVVRRLN